MEQLKNAVVIFAYNLESSIENCIFSVLNNSNQELSLVYVMANGCTDDTENIVKRLQKNHTNLRLVSIPKADKCHAWNEYIHHHSPNADVHIFVDGDVVIESQSITSINAAFSVSSELNIVGGVPTVGRDKVGWTLRMKRFGRVSGGLYGLSNRFISELQSQKIRLPIGFVGEDFLISSLAKGMLDFNQLNRPSIKLKIAEKAGFTFKSLSKTNPRDYWSYFRRLIRYRIRDYELLMLSHLMQTNGSMPETVEELYNKSAILPDYYWRGKFTPIDWIAVYLIRRQVKSKSSRFFN